MQAGRVRSQIPIGHPPTSITSETDLPLCVQDVTAKRDGQLVARAFVSTPTLLPLQGSIAAALVAPNLQQVACHSHTSIAVLFIVVTSITVSVHVS